MSIEFNSFNTIQDELADKIHQTFDRAFDNQWYIYDSNASFFSKQNSVISSK